MAEAVAKEGGDPVRMNEFELLDELGKGSHGVVHKASWAHVRGHSTFVAIKTMNKKQLKRKRHFRKVAGRVQRTTELDSVKREIAVQRKLKHKNILQLIDVLEVNGSDELHLVLELASHGSLMDYDKESNTFSRRGSAAGGSALFHESEALIVARQILSGLHYLHSNGVVHRDLKPENILLTQPLIVHETAPRAPPTTSGGGPALLPLIARQWSQSDEWEPPAEATVEGLAREAPSTPTDAPPMASITGSAVRLADLGCAYVFDDSEDSDRIRATAGTPTFHSPDMVSGDDFSACKADVWAFGCTLFAMLTGHMPVDGISATTGHTELVEALQAPVLRLDRLQCSRPCRAFLSKALAVKEADRATVEELALHPWVVMGGSLPPATADMHVAESAVLSTSRHSPAHTRGPSAAPLPDVLSASLRLHGAQQELLVRLAQARLAAVRMAQELGDAVMASQLNAIREPVEHTAGLGPTVHTPMPLLSKSNSRSGQLGMAPYVTESEIATAYTPVLNLQSLARLKVRAASVARRLSRTYAQRMAGQVIELNRVVHALRGDEQGGPAEETAGSRPTSEPA